MSEPGLFEVLSEAFALPDGPLKVELLASAARIADAENDLEAGYEVRLSLLSAAYTAGLPDYLMVAFSWCLGQSDRDPERFPPETLMYQYRLVASTLPQFPQVPRLQIEAAHADMAQRFAALGHSPRAVHLLKMFLSMKMKDPLAAKEAWKKCIRSRRDEWTDSLRTEHAFHIECLVLDGKYREAVKLSPDVMSCQDHVQHFFACDSGELLAPLLELGQSEDAHRLQKAGYRAVSENPKDYRIFGQHIAFLARVDDFTSAARIARSRFVNAYDSPQQMYRWDFLTAVLLLVERMKRAGHATLKLRLPEKTPLIVGKKGYDLGELSSWLRDEVEPTAARFDARNGNRWFSDTLNALPELAERAAP